MFTACVSYRRIRRLSPPFSGPFKSRRSDWSNIESWEERGSVDTVQRANGIWKKVLAEFEPPPMDGAIREELTALPLTTLGAPEYGIALGGTIRVPCRGCRTRLQ